MRASACSERITRGDRAAVIDAQPREAPPRHREVAQFEPRQAMAPRDRVERGVRGAGRDVEQDLVLHEALLARGRNVEPAARRESAGACCFFGLLRLLLRDPARRSASSSISTTVPGPAVGPIRSARRDHQHAAAGTARNHAARDSAARRRRDSAAHSGRDRIADCRRTQRPPHHAAHAEAALRAKLSPTKRERQRAGGERRQRSCAAIRAIDRTWACLRPELHELRATVPRLSGLFVAQTSRRVHARRPETVCRPFRPANLDPL